MLSWLTLFTLKCLSVYIAKPALAFSSHRAVTLDDSQGHCVVTRPRDLTGPAQVAAQVKATRGDGVSLVMKILSQKTRIDYCYDFHIK